MHPESKMKLMKLMGKKPKLSDKEKQAKMSVLDELDCAAKDALASKLPAKKVTVASDSPEGLKEGLEKAEELVESGMEGMEDESDMEESEGEEMPEMAEMSEEEIDRKLAELMALKEAKKKA